MFLFFLPSTGSKGATILLYRRWIGSAAHDAEMSMTVKRYNDLA